MKKRITGIECRGTKFNLMVAKVTRDILESATLVTESPKITFRSIINWLNPTQRKKQFDLVGFGMGAGGSVTHDPTSVNFRYSLKTPKPGWTAVETFAQHPTSFPVSVFHRNGSSLRRGWRRGLKFSKSHNQCFKGD